MGSRAVLYSADGKEYEFEPAMHVSLLPLVVRKCLTVWSFQNKDSLKSFASFLSAIKADYVDEMPRFLSRPDESGLKIISYEDYIAMSIPTMQDLLARYQCLVITGMPVEEAAFDEATLSVLRPLHHGIEFSDLSVPSTGNGMEMIKQGTLFQILEASRHENGKTLNALDLPMETASVQPYPIYASDLIAWRHATGRPGFGRSQPLPTGDLRWGLAATKDAITFQHKEANGLSTSLDTITGTKIWIFERDVAEQSNDPKSMFAKNLNLEKPREYPIEAVVLRPGTRL